MRISMFIGNPKTLKKDKYFTPEENKCFKMFHSGRKKTCFGNSQNVLFMNEIELESPLSTASMWLLRSSERRDQLWDKSLETTGWVNWDLRFASSILQSRKLSCSEVKTQGYQTLVSVAGTWGGFFIPCGKVMQESHWKTHKYYKLWEHHSHHVSSQDTLFCWRFGVIYFF